MILLASFPKVPSPQDHHRRHPGCNCHLLSVLMVYYGLHAQRFALVSCAVSPVVKSRHGKDSMAAVNSSEVLDSPSVAKWLVAMHCQPCSIPCTPKMNHLRSLALSARSLDNYGRLVNSPSKLGFPFTRWAPRHTMGESPH